MAWVSLYQIVNSNHIWIWYTKWLIQRKQIVGNKVESINYHGEANDKDGLKERLATFGQVSVPQAIADMAYNEEKWHMNHGLIYEEWYKHIE